MPSKLVQARNIRNNDVILASTADELVTLLALYKGTSAADPYYQIPVTIQLLPIDYTFTAAQLPLPIRSNMSLLGTGAQQTRLISAQTTSVGAKNIIECRDLWSSGGGSAGKCRHVTLGQFTVVGDAYAPAGIYARGLNNSIIHDVMLKNLTASGSIGIQLDAEDTFGCYYNHLHSIDIGYSGSDGAGIGIRIKTTDLATQPKRANSNTLTMCSVKYCVDAAYELNGCVATTFTGCEAEINAVGFRVLSSINTVISGGYSENNSSSDIQLGSLSGPPESSSQTVIMQPLLASTTRLAGQSRGSTGDLYVIANDSTAPSATKYDGTWSDKSYVGALSAGYADFSAYSSATRVGYYKLSGDSNYRLEVQNDGKLKWGGGSAATDIEMFWEAANVLSLGNNDTFRLNGGSGWIQWASASGATADISMYRWGADVLTLFNGDSFQIASTGKLLFTSTTAGSPDAAFARSSAGVLEINNGTLGTYRDLLVRNLTSSGTVTIGTYTFPSSDGTANQVLQTNGTGTVTWATVSGGGGGGITSINGDTTAAQLLTVGTSGTDFNIDSVTTAGTSVFNIPDASATARGLVTTGTQTFAGAKTFSGNVTFSGGTIAGASNVLTLVNSTSAQTFNIANTYTSSTNFEYGRFQWNTNEFRIGTAVGSAGGTQRNLVLGTWNSAGTWSPIAQVTTGGLVFPGSSFGTATYAMSSQGYHTITLAGNATSNGMRIQASSPNTTGASLWTGDANNGTQPYWYFGDTSASTSITGAGSVLRLYCTTAGGGAVTHFNLVGMAHTGQTASTEVTDVNFNLARTVTWAAGALTTQRAFRIQAPTYAFASASTITTAATLSISGAPTAGTNATLTNSFALWVETGQSQFGGLLNTTAAVVLNTGSQAFTTSFHFINWNGAGMGWSSGGTVNSTSTLETAFYRNSANIVDLRSGTTAVALAVYNTYVSATNYERTVLDWKTTANTFRFGTEKGSGGGTARDIVFVTDATDRMTITSTGLIHSSKIIGQTSETANTPSATTQTITLDSGNHQILNLGSSTGDVTVTLTIPTKSSVGSILVKQHGTTARNITWSASSGSVVWLGTQPTWSSDGTGKYRRVAWYYSPTESTTFLAASDSN